MKRAMGRERRSLGTRVFRALGLLFSAVLAMQLLYGGAVPAESLDGLLRKGVRKYGRGDYEKALEHMINAGNVNPENPVPAYYAGLIMLRMGRIDDAIGWWRDYIGLDGGSEAGDLIRRHLTLLERMSAERAAAEVISGGLDRSQGNIDPLTTVVVGFDSTLRSEWSPLRKGLKRVLVDDLSKVGDLRVIDGERVGELMHAQKLIDTSPFEPEAAVLIGRELGAMTVTTGVLSEPDPSFLVVKLVTIETTRGSVFGERKIRVPVWRFWELEKTLAFEILDELGFPKESLSAAVVKSIGKIQTGSFQAMLQYSQGLALMEESRYREARKAFEAAVTSDSRFELARAALAAAPAADITVEEIIVSVEETASSMKTRFSIREEPYRMNDGY